ncbi:HAD domain-containing protein [Cupriavidus sp. CV2]|uniref:HAD domain-containing protein n=1 Tax=Cupriavidus ulmosensis TaxID=3065913 RepID=UPI00296B0AC2|nr:HAD domain-containing protein [Cupriavidus sp. CV2]MDW3687816.1 HAD domain-containing protein [Cupriavidus sp. CV2]
MSERLIMLDVPGVLYSDHSEARLGGLLTSGTLRDVKFFDPIALGFIRRLFGLTGARVVVSDAWRRGTPAAILQQLDLQVEGMMPAVAGGPGAEIAAYLASRPALQSYVILTCAGSSIADPQRPHLVNVNPAEGMTVENFKQALDVLGVACPSSLDIDSKVDARLEARLHQLRRLARAACGALPRHLAAHA